MIATPLYIDPAVSTLGRDRIRQRCILPTVDPPSSP
jgi:hypothetical protein